MTIVCIFYCELIYHTEYILVPIFKINGVKTRLGTVRTPYEHFYAWRRVNDGDAVSTLPFAETETMIKGVYSPARFLEIFRDYRPSEMQANGQ